MTGKACLYKEHLATGTDGLAIVIEELRTGKVPARDVYAACVEEDIARVSQTAPRYCDRSYWGKGQWWTNAWRAEVDWDSGVPFLELKWFLLLWLMDAFLACQSWQAHVVGVGLRDHRLYVCAVCVGAVWIMSGLDGIPTHTRHSADITLSVLATVPLSHCAGCFLCSSNISLKEPLNHQASVFSVWRGKTYTKSAFYIWEYNSHFQPRTFKKDFTKGKIFASGFIVRARKPHKNRLYLR